tara:strand:- start:229 stop:798 length:570 start_codon:yes stop_codon:yes gene_type:complete
MADFTVFTDIDTLLQSANNAAARTNLGLGTAATTASTAYATAAQGVLAGTAQQPPVEGPFVDGDKTNLDANTAKVTYPSADSTKLAGYSPIAIITDATTARSLALTDIGGYIRLTNAASCTITLPANATVAWASETEPPTIYFRVAAAGIPALSNAGVTVNDTLGVVAALEAGSTFALQWVATDVWDII